MRLREWNESCERILAPTERLSIDASPGAGSQFRLQAEALSGASTNRDGCLPPEGGAANGRHLNPSALL